MEAQVQNITAAPLCLEKVDLEPSTAFSCIPMNGLTTKDMLLRSRLSITSANLQKPKWPNLLLDVEGSHQFLYRLIPKVENARTSTNIGKLDIVWKTSMGGSGRLQTSQLQRQVLEISVQYMQDITTFVLNLKF